MSPPTKRRRLEPTKAVEEITFDLAARQEYLTGFHKRKVQRTKAAQEAAERRAREERIRDRAKLREERKADLERHVEEVNAMLRPLQAGGAAGDLDSASDDESGDEWDGIDDDDDDDDDVQPPPPIDHEAEYVDEDKYTTVTVEAVDVSRDGLIAESEHRGGGSSDNGDAALQEDNKSSSHATKSKINKRPWSKENPNKVKAKKKKRNFRYESKAERKVARTKERSKNSKQARERRSK